MYAIFCFINKSNNIRAKNDEWLNDIILTVPISAYFCKRSQMEEKGIHLIKINFLFAE